MYNTNQFWMQHIEIQSKVLEYSMHNYIIALLLLSKSIVENVESSFRFVETPDWCRWVVVAVEYGKGGTIPCTLGCGGCWYIAGGGDITERPGICWTPWGFGAPPDIRGCGVEDVVPIPPKGGGEMYTCSLILPYFSCSRTSVCEEPKPSTKKKSWVDFGDT